MTDISEWQGRVGTSWAREWRRTDRSFGALTELLLARAIERPFTAALDIGCGAGEMTAGLAEAEPSARVIGLDISQDLVAVARERVRDLSNAAIELGDASRWMPSEDFRPDLVLSRHGVMFFADPVAAFAHIRAQAQSGARLVFSCFRQRAENQWVAELAKALPESETAPPSSPEEPGPFAFGRSERVAPILEQAGWQDIAFQPVDYPMIAGAGADPVGDAMSYFLRIGPAARAMAELEEDARETALAKLEEVLRQHLDAGVVTLPAAAWIVSASAP
ncbi:methyltransferase domain-containing protein [Qipengyuania sp. XHP0207]|uniref:class I SAM-dependent methyltransferase n=1 Tax=Qipengyuania sp. XHP0207 TaxID=3038078 RepID=UPI00241C5209|nr:class I SAM-dependent methyltransferase [Qipengyuania sp. XHP0207]MDG5747260.1 methyltransferase domain-containing protein [Qipengyuania sp. XHP0207]